MLNQNQIRRLEAIERWLREIQDSEEFKAIDYHPDLMIGDAIQAVGELLNEEGKPTTHIYYVVPMREKVRRIVLNAATQAAFLGFVTTGFMMCGALFCHGLDRAQSKSDWANTAKAYEGAALASTAVFLGACLTGACASAVEEE
ncbi:hypothetical protein [Tolypothrix sp. VBCCA 56010]|uniref:hypothetical protein n=1 Tax=Tolypothrix sp. VBCCA 56010 TaxID=3137731 RepID=UPI003D7F154E